MTTFERVREVVITSMECEEKDVMLQTKLVDDLGADSLDIVDIAMAIEEEFGLEIPDEDVERLRKISDVVHYIDSHL